MPNLNNFTSFELNTEETINVNGGFGNRLGHGRINGRFGKENIQFIYGDKMPVISTFEEYASFDFAGFEATKETPQPEFTSDQLDPTQVIL